MYIGPGRIGSGLTTFPFSPDGEGRGSLVEPDFVAKGLIRK